jgi:tetratricopeptide (TPR) repeat protein
MVMEGAHGGHPMTAFDAELAKARKDISALELLAQRDPRDPEKRVRLAYRQFHQASLTGSESDFRAAKQTCAEMIRDFGPKEDICLLEANIAGRFHCLAEARQALQMCPSLARRMAGRSLLADLDFQEGRYDQAHAAWEDLIAEQRTWDNLARLAHWKGKLGQIDEADQLYEEAAGDLTAKEMRSFAWIEVQRGALALSHGRPNQARAHYERASRSYSGHWYTDEHLAGSLAAEGKPEEALALLQKVSARVPKPELKQTCGELLRFLGRADEAQPWLQAAEQAYLSSAQEGAVHYYHHLADFYADAGSQPAEAVKWARKDVALRANFSTQSALAWALYQSGDAAEGLAWIRRALASGVQDAGIFATASAIFNACGDAAEGGRYARAAAAINPNGQNFHMHH